MSELTQMIEWAFGGFWRFVGFAVLLSIVSGAAMRLLAAVLFVLTPTKR